MYELHEYEQYFFDRETLDKLAMFISTFKDPCCLCAPLLGRELVNRGIPVGILDIDKRFEEIPGFVYFDIYRPRKIPKKFDIILCDPPFFKVSLSQLFRAIYLLSHFNFSQKILISYLTRRELSILKTFTKFNLKATNLFPTYQTVQNCRKNDIQFYSNLPQKKIIKLRTLQPACSK